MRVRTHCNYNRIFFAITVFTFLLTGQSLATNYKVVDLNPSGIANSWAIGINGQQQVGYGIGTTTGNYHAFVWNGN
jgi:hypothetical protein